MFFKKFFRFIFFTALLIFFTLVINPDQITYLATSKADQLKEVSNEVSNENFQPQIVQKKSIPTSLGELTYYSQHDERWSNYLYGGSDPMHQYGCGPTVISMIISSFTDKSINPAEMADWAYKNSYWAPGSGSFHSLIPQALSQFGFQTKSIRDKSAQSIVSKLESGYILVALMDNGHFTQSGGHFIILTGISDDGRICVADSNNPLITEETWDPALISNELRKEAGSGGPLWAVSR